MVDVDKSVIARIKKEGGHFEILVDSDKALDFRAGKITDVSDVVAVTHVFFDVKKGLKASEVEVKKAFGTDNLNEVFATIIKHGEVQLTAKHLAKLQEDKKKQIINIIHRNGIDSKTGLPHPPDRIERAMEEAKVRIDAHKSAEEQVSEVLSKIRAIIPIKFEVREVQVIIPAQYGAQCYSVIKRRKALKEEWLDDGSLMAVVEIPAGVQEEFFSELNKIAHGEIESKILKVK